MSVLKSKRGWLEKQSQSGSYYVLSVGNDDHNKGYVELALADCYRRIGWEFGKPGDKRAIKKIDKIKKLIDSIHTHLHSKDK